MLKELLEKYFKDILADNPKIEDELNTIFESSVNKKVTEELKKKEDELDSLNEEKIKVFKTSLIEKLDEYISLSMDEFVEENKKNIESNFKVELAEKHLTILKNLLKEESVEIPTEQADKVKGLEGKMEKLSSKLNEKINSEIELKKQIFEYEKANKFMELSKDLSETKKEKLLNLTESIVCEDIEDFAKKVNILKENLIDKKEDTTEDLTEDFTDDKTDLDKYLP